MYSSCARTFEGIHPTLRQVPPRVLSFSTQTVCTNIAMQRWLRENRVREREREWEREHEYLHSQLCSLDGSHIATWPTTYHHQVSVIWKHTTLCQRAGYINIIIDCIITDEVRESSVSAMIYWSSPNELLNSRFKWRELERALLEGYTVRRET